MAKQSAPAQDQNFEVVVVGGGLAGICAALSAARQGAKCALVTDRPVLGGNSSTEIRVPPSSAGDHSAWAKETGIVDELITEERARSQDIADTGLVNSIWDLVLYDACRREPNLTLYLNTMVNDAQCDADDAGRRVIRTADALDLRAERAYQFHAPVFIDASGDGILLEKADVPWRMGREGRSDHDEWLAPEHGDNETLGCSLQFRARDIGRPVPFTPPDWAECYPDEASLNFRVHRPIWGGYWWIEYCYPHHPIHDDSLVRDELLRHVLGVWDHIKNHCEKRADAANYALEWVGMLPGRRESRRCVGDFVMNSRHMLAGELFPDRIGFGGWEVDDHEHQGITAQSQHPTKAFYVAPYSVPLRSLVAGKAASNLFLAGRILSVSRLVFLSLRVQCTLGALGQAAGTAAVRSLVTGRTAVDLTDEDVYAVQQSLLRDDCFIPAVSSSDPLDYARNATAVASSEARLALEPDFGDGASAELKLLRGQIVPVSADRIDTVELYLENRDDAEKPVEITAYPARDMWDLDVFPAWRLPQRLAPAKPEPVQIGRAVAQLPGNYSGWTKFELNAKVKPGTLVWLLVSPTDGVAWRFSNSTPPGTIAAAPGSRADSHATTEDWWEIPPGRMACPFHSRGLWRSHAVRISPESTPFGAQNVLNGVSRPDAWSNAWVSDPEQAFLQTIDIDLGGRKTISSIALSFDNNLNRTRWRMPAFWRAPECVRDFAISVKSADSDSWMEVASVTGNYQRHRVIAIPKTAASHLRLTIHATNGEASATVYEIRVY